MTRRFTIEELTKGWLLKVTEAGSDRIMDRYAFLDLEELILFLRFTIKDNSK